MKKLIIVLCLLCLFGCAINKPIHKQRWYPNYILNEINVMEEELIELATMLEKGKITFAEYDYLSHLRYNYCRMRLSGNWEREKK